MNEVLFSLTCKYLPGDFFIMENMCPHCQMEVPKGKFVCPICGIDLRNWNPDKLRCPICRSLYPQGTKFCLKDGSPLEKAIVNFDTEATIFLSGSLKTQKPKSDDIIPQLKFFDDQNRAFPKLERDQKGHLVPPTPPKQVKETQPQTFSNTTPAEPERELPKITTVPSPQPHPTGKHSAQPPPQIEQPPQPQEPSLDVGWDMKTRARSSHPKVKPLEEYERLLKEEKQRTTFQRATHSDAKESRFQMGKYEHPGFFKRVIIAIKVLFGK